MGSLPEAEDLNQYRRELSIGETVAGTGKQAGESGVVVEQKDAPVYPGGESSSFELSRKAQIQSGE